MATPTPTGPCSVICILFAAASMWMSPSNWHSSEGIAPAAAPEEPYGGNSIGQILVVLLILWLALLVAGAALKGKAASDEIFGDAIQNAMRLGALIFLGALITPMYSTVFVFNGPKYAHMVRFSFVFEVHAGVYNMATQQLLTLAEIALPCFILWIGTRILAKYISWFSLICPSEKVKALANSLPQAMDLILTIPLLMLFCGWVCWLTMLLTRCNVGEKTVFSWMAGLLSWIDGHTHNLFSHIAYSVFGKWR